MVNLLGSVKFAGADTHKGNSVTVCLVHIGLNLKYKSGEIIAHRIYKAAVCHSWKRGCGHFQEMLQESLHTKVGKS